MSDSTDERFSQLVDGVEQDLENKALTQLLESALKAIHICGEAHKTAREVNLPRDLAESMTADLWQVLMMPFVTSHDHD